MLLLFYYSSGMSISGSPRKNKQNGPDHKPSESSKSFPKIADNVEVYTLLII